MIGGIDVRLKSAAGIKSIEVAVRAIRQVWPRAVFENGNTGEQYPYFWQIPFGNIEELFVYKDATSADLWDKQGAIPEVQNAMIHVLYDVGLLTLVIDEWTDEMKAAIDAVRSALEDTILSLAALPEAAA